MKKLIICIVLLIIANVANAGITSHTNPITHGSSVTFTGSDFGSKSTPAPIENFTFDSGTVGNLIAESGITDLSTKFRYVTGSDSFGYGNGIKGNAKHTIGESGDEAYLWYNYESDQTEVYWSFYCKLDLIKGDTDSSGTQIKWYSVRDNPYTVTSGFGSYPYYRDNGSTVDWISGAIKDNVLAGGSYYGSSLHWGHFLPNQAWFRVEIYGKRNSADGAADGTWTVTHLIDGVANDVIVDSGTLVTHLSGDNNWSILDFKHDLENTTESDADVDFYYDDWIVDSTPARVEIGNSSTWVTCTKRVYQPATEWDATGDRIIVTINQGDFSSGETAYVYVVDSDYVISTGYPVTFSASTNPTVSITTTASTTASEVTVTGSITAVDGTTITGATCTGGYTVTLGTPTGLVYPFSVTVPLVVGDNTFTITATDSASNTGSSSTTVTRTSGTNPIVSMPADYSTTSTPTSYTASVTVSTGRAPVSGTSSLGGTVTFGTPTGDVYPVYVTGVPLSSGANSEALTVTDDDGESGAGNMTITLTTTTASASASSINFSGVRIK